MTNSVDNSATLKLHRKLGFRDLLAYGLAYIAPTAPFATLGFVWGMSNGLIGLAYLLGAICVYFTAKSYAVMTEVFPSAGSVYSFTQDTFGPFAGFMAGWMILLDYLLIPAFIYAAMAVGMSTLLPSVDRAVWIVLIVGVAFAVNWFGVGVTSRVSMLSVMLQFLMVAGVVWIGIWALHNGNGNGRLTLLPLINSSHFQLDKVAAATSVCLMAYLGFDAVSTLAEEVKESERKMVGKAILAILGISASTFVAFAWIIGNLMPGLTVKDPAAAIYELVGWAAGPWAAALLAWLVAIIVGFTNALPMQVGVARVLFAMGRDKALPSFLGRVHAVHGTPHVSMILSTGISMLVAIIMRGRLDVLASIVSVGALSSFLFLHASVLFNRAVRKEDRGWWQRRAVPILGFAIVTAVLIDSNHVALLFGGAWAVVGGAYGMLKRCAFEKQGVPDSNS